jgi:hypothetical protein
MRFTPFYGAVLTAAFAVGCASGSPLPAERIASSEGAVRAAEEAGASNNNESSLHLRLAREQIEKAKKLAEDGEEERVELMLDRARVDAELALALATEDTSKKDAAKTIDEIRGLKRPTPTTTGSSDPSQG